MKKIIIFTIFTVLMIFSIQQISYAEEPSEEKDRSEEVKEAYKIFKRDLPVKNNTEIIEEEKKKELKKIPSKLKKILPTEEQLEKITLRTIWKFIDKQSNFDEEVGIETMTALLRDITRVYDPIVNKYRVATIQIEIIKYDDIYELEYYWDEISVNSLEKIFDNGYLLGSPNEDIDCMFNHSEEGAMTLCKSNEYIIQSTIYDKYQEHFSYNKLKVGSEKLELTQDEMTTRIVDIILKNIDSSINEETQLYKMLESNREIKESELKEKQVMNKKNKEEVENNNLKVEQNRNKLLGIEKDKKYGIQKFSCIKDEFGLITISGQFNNNQIKKDKVVLDILFLDYEQNIIFKNSANLLDIDKFETKRFLGNTKIDESYSTCTVKANY
ncbi:hypothetical protein OAJ02_07615 [Nitrosopumilus sp.]|nr:hypothetical protein [Nitrosopumilus sp.]